MNVAKRVRHSERSESREAVNEGKGNPPERRKVVHPITDEDYGTDVKSRSKYDADRNKEYPNMKGGAESKTGFLSKS